MKVTTSARSMDQNELSLKPDTPRPLRSWTAQPARPTATTAVSAVSRIQYPGPGRRKGRSAASRASGSAGPEPAGGRSRCSVSLIVMASLSDALAVPEDVVDARAGPEFFLEPHGVVFPEELRQPDGGAETVDGDVGDQVADVEHAHGAAGHAAWKLPMREPVDAQHALADGALDLRHRELRRGRHRQPLGLRRIGPVEVPRLVRAGGHAGAAADAHVLVDKHDAVGVPEGGPDRAHVRAGRVLAHHAEPGHVEGSALGVGHRVDLQPGLVLGQLVAFLAGERARLAAVAVTQVDDHAPGVLGLGA